MIRILTIILLFLTNESNGMNRKHSETDDNIKESSTSLSPHDDVMRRILRSRAGESETLKISTRLDAEWCVFER